MPFNFKVKLGEETRRLTFPQLPTWQILSTKLQVVYDIPKDNIAVSYVDAENDEITMSSEEELNDYYSLFEAHGHTFKLDVHDLTSLRDRTAATSTPKVPVGMFDLDEDWQRLPSFHGASEAAFLRAASTSFSQHAFVEEINDGNSTTKDAQKPLDSASEDGASTIRSTVDKGKGKEVSSTNCTSVESLLDEEAPVKHEIHVLNQSVSLTDTPIGGATETTLPQDRPTTSRITPSIDDPTDPPLPSISDPALGDSTVSLANDLTALMSTLTNVVTHNPELSTNFHRIFHNASTGAYWNAHRASLAQQVNELSGSIGATTEEFRRQTEQEAARRVFTALGGFVRTFSSFSPLRQDGSSSNSVPETAIPTRSPATMHHPPTPSPPPRIPTANLSSPLLPTDNVQLPPPSPLNRHAVPSPSAHPAPASEAAAAADGARHSLPPPPKGPPRFGAGSTRRVSNGQTGDIWNPESRPAWLPPPPPPIVDQTSQSSEQPDSSKLTPQELRVAVEEAKRKYREEKSKYRKEREERKRQRSEGHQRASHSGPDSTPAPQVKPTISQDSTISDLEAKQDRAASVLVSSARGPFPRLEMESVPFHRETRVVGNASSPSDSHQRAYSRIIKKLADMGFTETSYPSLPGAVIARVSHDGHIPRDEEDNIVTTLLEDLLANTSPKAPTASGSRAHASGW